MLERGAARVKTAACFHQPRHSILPPAAHSSTAVPSTTAKDPAMAEHQQRRPPLLHRLSSYISTTAGRVEEPPGSGPKGCAPSQRVPCERSPLLGAAFLTANGRAESDQPSRRPLSRTAVISRPDLTRAATTTTNTAPTVTTILATPRTARPDLTRAITSTAALTGRPGRYESATLAAMEHSRSSLLSRAAQAISDQLELGDGTSYAHRNAPSAPSYWNDRAHRRCLIRLWDAVGEQAAQSKYAVSSTARLVSTEKSMLHHFPELGTGDEVLTRDFVEYVLGLALVHPFCTAENMGRWEILAASSGARGTWGPW